MTQNGIHSFHKKSRGVMVDKHTSINFETAKEIPFSSISPSKSSITRLAIFRKRIMLTHH